MSASDNFNRADSTTTINPRSDGGTWLVSATGPTVGLRTSTWGVSSNRGYCVTAPSYSSHAYRGIAYFADAADGELSCDFPAVAGGSTEAGLCFRLSSSTVSGFFATRSGVHYLDGTYDGSGSANSTTMVATFTSGGFTTGDRMTVILLGTSVTIKKNGSTTVGSFTSSNNLTEVRHGLWQTPTFAAAWRFDNFSFTSPNRWSVGSVRIA